MSLALVLLSPLARAESGGPDAFGYQFDDQDSGVSYTYVDISASGTLVASGDEAVATVVLGAPLSVYGQMVGEVAVSTNGFFTDVAGAVTDPTNDCPLPATPSEGAGSFRVAVLHDDLVSDVYYQYFTEAEAAAVGFANQTEGMSVIQWVGLHATGEGGLVDAQVVLQHNDGDLQVMVAADAAGGAGSTIGIQSPDASTALEYGCGDNSFITPGDAAILFQTGLAPTTDCCTNSNDATPGCLETVCQDAVCDIVSSCCSVEWDSLCASLAVNFYCPIYCDGPLPEVVINEVRVDQDGDDDDEYFELVGSLAVSLHELTYIVLGDSPSGQIEAVVELDDQFFPDSGYFVAAESTFSLGTADMTTELNFENDDTVTHMLVAGFSGSLGDQLDIDGDGTLDSTPWVAQIDTVVITEPMGEDFAYGPGSSCEASATCQEVSEPGDTPTQIYRCEDESGAFLVGNTSVEEMLPTDTPGGPNACHVCGDGLVESVEECDDVGESAACDVDCTLATCGDGTINLSAAEECDDMGESAACNADCTMAQCGDMVINASAGESCDDGGDSETCDSDCTEALCGDATVNAQAGEECDDGNRIDGDGCSASCASETEPTTGGEESTGDGDTTGGDATDGSSATTADGGSTGNTDETSGFGETTDPGASTGGEPTSDGSGGAVPGEVGCGCTTAPDRGGMPWAIVALLGLAGLRRRRIP